MRNLVWLFSERRRVEINNDHFSNEVELAFLPSLLRQLRIWNYLLTCGLNTTESCSAISRKQRNFWKMTSSVRSARKADLDIETSCNYARFPVAKFSVLHLHPPIWKNIQTWVSLIGLLIQKSVSRDVWSTNKRGWKLGNAETDNGPLKHRFTGEFHQWRTWSSITRLPRPVNRDGDDGREQQHTDIGMGSSDE